MYDPYALFPFEQVEKGNRVIIYGAGRAGQNFFQQAGGTGYCVIVALVDKDSKKHNSMVKGIEALLDLGAYDYVVISPISFPVRLRIRDELIAFGVPEEKIVVPSTKNLLYWSLDGLLQQIELQKTAENLNVAEIEARSLVSSLRLDIGIKWLLIRDIANEVKNDENISLYARHILAWTRGLESFSASSDNIRDGVDEYIDTAKNVMKNIVGNGFDREKPIPVTGDDIPLDGTHRIASCIQADTPIWVKRFPGLESKIKDYKWYWENGFETNDMLRIFRAFTELYQGEYAIALLYGPAIELWNFILKQLEQTSKIVGYTDIDFESNYIAFETLINDIYFYQFGYGDDRITAKIDLLKLAPLKIRVVVLSDELKGKGDFFGNLREFKLRLRDATFFDFKNIELQFHSSDTMLESVHLKNVLLSPNNLKYVSNRFKPQYTKRFIELLDKFKILLKKHNMPTEDVCIVNSGVMAVLGLREIKDLDFICLQADVSKLDDVSRMSDVIELRDDLIAHPLLGINNDTLIADDNYHFMFYGLKFCNLEFVRAKKSEHGRDKDIRDMRLIDLFNESVRVYDSKIALQKGIYKEIVRRRLNNRLED